MITKAEYIKDYQIKVYFADGTIKSIDLFDFLSTSSHPLINKYLNVELFRQFQIDSGVICWGENEFDLNPETIYKGRYDAKPGKSKTNFTHHLKTALKEVKAGKSTEHKNTVDLFSKSGIKSTLNK